MKYPILVALAAAALAAQTALPSLGPLLHAHNCYPYNGQWSDRIDRALASTPRAVIEQDLAWHDGKLVVSHETATQGDEPTLEAHFFARVRPMIEQALRDGDREQWPVVILHLDFKENSARTHRALWDLLVKYESWITTAPKLADSSVIVPLERKPLLVLTEDNDLQEQNFFQRVPEGGRLLVFGSAHSARMPENLTEQERAHWLATTAPEQLLTERPTNYRRWWNNSWAAVEEGGQAKAGAWSSADDARLRALVNHAHNLGYWIRFYTLNGHSAAQDQGWSAGYNFGSLEAVEPRWRAAIAAGVDLIATDQYEEFGRRLASSSR